jgi:hypothetical protein
VSLCLFAAWGLYTPRGLLRVVKAALDADWGIYVAVGIRLLLGGALIVVAPGSKFPTVFLIVGWVAVVAAVTAVLIGRKGLRRFANWWIERFQPAGIRLWVLIALAFGGFLIYGIA